MGKLITKTLFVELLVISLFQSRLGAQQVTFSDVADSMGIMHPYPYIRGGVSFCDFDNDGLEDLSINSNAGEPIYLYKNSVTHFVDVTAQTGIIDSLRSMMFLWADYDNDGDKDVFIAHDGSPNRLFRNDGRFTFTDVTAIAGISTDNMTTNVACWGDYDNDGWLDLYVTNYSEYQRNYLYRNNGNGTFADVTAIAGVADTLGSTSFYKLPLAVVFLDYDNDGWHDIYIANDHFVGNTLFKNMGDGTFTDVSESSNADLQGFMMGLAIGDYDNNGYLDMYSTNDPWGNFFLRNNGDGTFTELADSLGIAVYKVCWGANFVDYDNDTDLDLYVSVAEGTPNRNNAFFENLGNGVFSPLTAIGLDHSYKSYGNAIGDFDNNGYCDIAVFNQQALVNLYKSSGGVNNWIKIELEGTGSNRDGIGTWIDIYRGGEKFSRYTHCGISYLSQNSSIQTIGVGSTTVIDSIVIRWPGPDYRVDILRSVAVNQKLLVVEGQGVTTIDRDATGPPNYALDQNYPNPFNPSTSIQYSLSKSAFITLKVYSILGEDIRTLIDRPQQAGTFQVAWDGRSNTGSRVSSGLYFYRFGASAISGESVSISRKMILLK